MNYPRGDRKRLEALDKQAVEREHNRAMMQRAVNQRRCQAIMHWIGYIFELLNCYTAEKSSQNY